MTDVLGSSRRYPCGHAKAKFKDLSVCVRRCNVCKARWEVSFESAPAASAMTRQIVWKARWRSMAEVLEVAG